MLQNKQVYAQAIAEQVNGKVVTIEKNNGVIKTGIQIPTKNASVHANLYIDDMFADGYTVDEAVEKINQIMKQEAEKDHNFDMDFITDFEQVKPLLRARLYNKATKSEVSRSAAKYGLEDLIITAAIDLPQEGASIRVKQEFLDRWNVTADEVLDIAEENSKEHAQVIDMADMLVEMGAPADMIRTSPRGQMIIVTNDTKCNGAYSLIAKLDELRQMFPQGFTVLPSSIHEVIVVPMKDERLDSMVQEVNDTQVDFEEQLSNHAYYMAA